MGGEDMIESREPSSTVSKVTGEYGNINWNPKPDLVVQYLAVDNMSHKDIVHTTLKAVREDFASHESDTGSSQVQVALLTTKIAHLSVHLENNRKDHKSQRGLLGMLSLRKRLLKYMQRKDPIAYQDTITKLGLRDRSFTGSRYAEKK